VNVLNIGKNTRLLLIIVQRKVNLMENLQTKDITLLSTKVISTDTAAGSPHSLLVRKELEITEMNFFSLDPVRRPSSSGLLITKKTKRGPKMGQSKEVVHRTFSIRLSSSVDN